MAKRVAKKTEVESSSGDETPSVVSQPEPQTGAFSKADLFNTFYQKTIKEIDELHSISKQNMMNTHLTAKLALLKAQLEKIKELMKT